METKGTVIGLGAKKEKTKADVDSLKNEIAKKDKEIKKLSEENTALQKKITELEKGGSENGTDDKDNAGGSGTSKGKKS